MYYMRCVHSNHLICNISFKISFIHHIILFMVRDQHGLQSQIRHWENCWFAIILPELISWFHSQVLINFNLKDRYHLMRLEIILFFSGSDTRFKLAAWKSLNRNQVFKSFFNQTNYHHIYTQSLHVVLA